MMLCQVINKMMWLWLKRHFNYRHLNHALWHWGRGLEASKKLNSALPKPSHVLRALPWGDANFHLIKVYDVSWDTKPDKLIHKSITYYHKLLSERRLQLDPRQSVPWCSSSHSNIGDTTIVTGCFFCHTWRFTPPPTPMVTNARQDPTCLGSCGRKWLNRPQRSSSMKTVGLWHDDSEGELLGLSWQGEWPRAVLSQLWSSLPIPKCMLNFLLPTHAYFYLSGVGMPWQRCRSSQIFQITTDELFMR